MPQRIVADATRARRASFLAQRVCEALRELLPGIGRGRHLQRKAQSE
jgi:hypothetical protein